MEQASQEQQHAASPQVLVLIQEQSLAASPREGELAEENPETSRIVVVINVQEEQPSSSSSSSKPREIDEPPVCRVCHLGSPEVPGELMELACVCKDDLAVAHRQCAEAWFRIRGNRKCEICGKIVTNITLKRGAWSRMTRIIRPEGEEVQQHPDRYPPCNALVTFFSLGILLPLLLRLAISK